MGGSRISGKGVHMYKGVCMCVCVCVGGGGGGGGWLALLIDLLFLKYPMKMIFIGYFKMWGSEGGSSQTPS